MIFFSIIQWTYCDKTFFYNNGSYGIYNKNCDHVGVCVWQLLRLQLKRDRQLHTQNGVDSTDREEQSKTFNLVSACAEMQQSIFAIQYNSTIFPDNNGNCVNHNLFYSSGRSTWTTVFCFCITAVLKPFQQPKCG